MIKNVNNWIVVRFTPRSFKSKLDWNIWNERMVTIYTNLEPALKHLHQYQVRRVFSDWNVFRSKLNVLLRRVTLLDTRSFVRTAPSVYTRLVFISPIFFLISTKHEKNIMTKITKSLICSSSAKNQLKQFLTLCMV